MGYGITSLTIVKHLNIGCLTPPLILWSMPVPNQESEWSCIYLLGVLIFPSYLRFPIRFQYKDNGHQFHGCLMPLQQYSRFSIWFHSCYDTVVRCFFFILSYGTSNILFPKDLNYLAFKYFGFQRNWWSVFQRLRHWIWHLIFYYCSSS